MLGGFFERLRGLLGGKEKKEEKKELRELSWEEWWNYLPPQLPRQLSITSTKASIQSEPPKQQPQEPKPQPQEPIKQEPQPCPPCPPCPSAQPQTQPGQPQEPQGGRPGPQPEQPPKQNGQSQLGEAQPEQPDQKPQESPRRRGGFRFKYTPEQEALRQKVLQANVGERVVCPKCGREGVKKIWKHGVYKVFVYHGPNDACYISVLKDKAPG